MDFNFRSIIKNTSLTWSNDVTLPEFTECFQNTVLVWLASGWVAITLPFYLPYLMSLKSEPLRVSKKHLAKIVLAMLQLVICVIEITYEVEELNRNSESYWRAALLGPTIEAGTLVVVLLYLEVERRKGFITSGVLFFYWVIANITYIIPFYQKIIKEVYSTNLLAFIVFNIYFLLSLTQLVLSSFAETIPLPPGHKPPFPELQASFLSRLTYHWINGMIVKGYKKPITEDDMYMLHPRDETKTIVEKFEKHWKAEQIKCSQKISRTHLVPVDVDTPPVNVSESSPLLSTQTPPQSHGAIGRSKSHDKSADTKPKISLAKVLFKTYGLEYGLSNLLKLIDLAMAFVNPMLLRLLIDFAERPEVPMYKGFVYCGSFLGVILVQSLAYNMLMKQTTFMAVRIRTSLISAIFKKALTVNSKARTESTSGEIVNLMSVDAENIRTTTEFFWMTWSALLQIIISIVYLYYTVGYSVFAGIGVVILLMPFNMVIIKYMEKYQTEQMTEKDNRIKLMTEVLNGIKILKLYAWEMAFGEKITIIRDRELRLIWKQAICNGLMMFSWTLAPFMVGLATFATYIFTTEDHKFDAQTAFVTIALYDMLRVAFVALPWMVLEAIKSMVSIGRINKFLNQEDIDSSQVTHNPSENAVSIENGTFSWNPEMGACLHNISMRVPKGSIVAVVGAVGAGKSSLLSAILGEMEKWDGNVNVDGRIAYVPQQAWIQNATVRDNILFGKSMNATQYEKIIEACALKSDLDILPGKDLTEIGERGINLSGGQRQRVSLARAAYFTGDIYLLDDPLSAVDSHVGKHIFQNVIGGDGILKNTTRVLVTHGIHWLPYVDQIIVITNGMVSEVGTYKELLSHNGDFATFVRNFLLEKDESDSEDDDNEEVKQLKELVLNLEPDVLTETGQARKRLSSRQESQSSDGKKGSRSRGVSESEHGHKGAIVSRTVSKEEKIPDKSTNQAKLIEEEDVEFGNVSWSVVVSYLKALGLKYAWLIFLLYGTYEFFVIWSSIWLTEWTADPQLQNLTLLPADSQERRDRNDMYLGIYGALGGAQAVFILLYSTVASIRMVRVGRVLHRKLLTNVLRWPMSLFDTTPIGRIVNRFSADIDSIDESIPHNFENLMYSLLAVLSTIVVISYSTPVFLIVIVPIAVVYIMIQQLNTATRKEMAPMAPIGAISFFAAIFLRFYIPISRQMQRLESKTLSPIFNHFNEVLTGVSVVRAFNVEDRFVKEIANRVDHNQKYLQGINAIYRWLGFRLEGLSSLVVLGASIFAVIERKNISGALVGLSISYALQITENLKWMVELTSHLETSLVSVERVMQYTQKPTEAPLKTSYLPPLGWPTDGHIDIKKYSLRYREGLDLVLKDVDVSIKPAEKIGIVGRTGAGKSSLTLALFRLIEPAGGRILIDGEDITHMGLFHLRSRLTILPQEPVLFSGSLRMNLDPLDEYPDNKLWEALEHAHLKDYVAELPNAFEYEVGEGGQNLSVGQRQLVCLARSLLRKTKILVLDEATAAVDLETDSLIQNTISKEFQDSTILTIAHRLNTVIDYDRILVLSDGQVVEYDAPKTLLQDTQSAFYAMAKDAGLV